MKELLEMNKPFKKYLPIYMIMLSIVLLMGTSYALLRSSHQGTNTYTMNVGTLAVTFVDSETNALTLENAYPMTDDEGMSETKELTFTVKNTGTVTAKYSVYIEETSTTPEFKSVIRFISNKNNTGYNSPKTLASDNYIDKDSYLETSKTATYKVKAWMADAADSTYMNKTFTARVVVTGEQASINPEYIRNVIKSKQTSTCKTYVDEDGITYVSGNDSCINFNYVWYSGKMWRITAVNSDGTMKMITDDNMTTISYGSNTTFANSYIYQWLNEDFLDTLYNYQNILVENSTWNATVSSNVTTKLGNTTLVSSTSVGLLNTYEYYMSYKNVGESSSYLNNNYWWWLLNSGDGSARIWSVNNSNVATPLKTVSDSLGVRPAINVKSNVVIASGSGTEDNPYRIKGDITLKPEGEGTLAERIPGEYVFVRESASDYCMYRIVSIDATENSVKLIRDEHLNSSLFSGTSSNWKSSEIYNYLNNTENGWLSGGNYFEKIIEGKYYIGTHAQSSNYQDTMTEETNSFVGIPRYGEMFAAPISSSENTWLITPSTDTELWSIYSDGSADIIPVVNAAAAIRPTIYLANDAIIYSGEGLPNDPFVLE